MGGKLPHVRPRLPTRDEVTKLNTFATGFYNVAGFGFLYGSGVGACAVMLGLQETFADANKQNLFWLFSTLAKFQSILPDSLPMGTPSYPFGEELPESVLLWPLICQHRSIPASLLH